MTPLRIGFIGSSFIARFHLKSLVEVRNVEVVGVYSPTAARREAFAQEVRRLELGDCTAHASLQSLLTDSSVDAVWNPYAQQHSSDHHARDRGCCNIRLQPDPCGRLREASRADGGRGP